MFSKILIVDDDFRIRELLEKYLIKNGYAVCLKKDVQEVSDNDLSEADLIILDVMLSGIDGISYLKTIKSKDYNKPVILLTALSEVDDKVKGFTNGADDYLTKPFEPEELLFRIKNLLKRISEPTVYKIGDIDISLNRMMMIKNGEEIQLSSSECIVLNILLQNINKTVSRKEIAKSLNIPISERSIDVHINRLRNKIEKNQKNPKYLKTIRHIGYMLIA